MAVALAGTGRVKGLAPLATEAAPAMALAVEAVTAARAVEGVGAGRAWGQVYPIGPPGAGGSSRQSEMPLRNGCGGGLDRAFRSGKIGCTLVEHGTTQRRPCLSLCPQMAGITLPALGARAVAAKAHAMAGAM